MSDSQTLNNLISKAQTAGTQLTKVGQDLNGALLFSDSGSITLENKLSDLMGQQQAIAAKNQELLTKLQSQGSTPGEYLDLVQQMSELQPSFPAIKQLLNSDLSGMTQNSDGIKIYLQKALEEANKIPLSDLQNLSNGLVRSSKGTPQETVQNKSGTSPTNPKGKTTDPQEQATAPAEQWGVKFSFTAKETMAAGFAGPANQTQSNYYLSLLPAMATQLPMQGAKDVPGSMPGLSFKVVPSVAKLKVPGFQPVFQHLGMDTLLITMVGCFTGADGAQLLTDSQANQSKIKNSALGSATLFDSYGVPGKSGEEGLREIASKLDSYRNFQEFYQFAVLQGRELHVEINLAKSSPVKVDPKAGDKPLRAANGNPKFKALVKSMEVYHARSDRTWYTMQLEVTDFGLAGDKPINLTNTLDSKIKAAQTTKSNDALKEKVSQFKSAQDKLKSAQYKQSLLDDGSYLYQFNDGTNMLQYIKDGAVDFREVSGKELEDLKKRITGELSGGDALKLAGTAIGCIGGLLLAETGVGAVVAAGACGTFGGLAIKSSIEGDSTLQEGAISAAIDVATLGLLKGAGQLGGGLLKNASFLKSIPGAGALGNLVKNIPGSTQLSNLTSSVVSGTGNLIQENGAKILRLLPNNGSTAKGLMEATGKQLFEPGAWKSPLTAKASNTLGKAANAINPFKAKTPPIVPTGNTYNVPRESAIVPYKAPVAAPAPALTPASTSSPIITPYKSTAVVPYNPPSQAVIPVKPATSAKASDLIKSAQ